MAETAEVRADIQMMIPPRRSALPMQAQHRGVGSGKDSGNYDSFEDMLAAYQADIAEIEAGDEYGKNIVELYDPTNRHCWD